MSAANNPAGDPARRQQSLQAIPTEGKSSIAHSNDCALQDTVLESVFAFWVDAGLSGRSELSASRSDIWSVAEQLLVEGDRLLAARIPRTLADEAVRESSGPLLERMEGPDHTVG